MFTMGKLWLGWNWRSSLMFWCWSSVTLNWSQAWHMWQWQRVYARRLHRSRWMKGNALWRWNRTCTKWLAMARITGCIFFRRKWSWSTLLVFCHFVGSLVVIESGTRSSHHTFNDFAHTLILSPGYAQSFHAGFYNTSWFVCFMHLWLYVCHGSWKGNIEHWTIDWT